MDLLIVPLDSSRGNLDSASGFGHILPFTQFQHWAIKIDSKVYELTGRDGLRGRVYSIRSSPAQEWYKKHKGDKVQKPIDIGTTLYDDKELDEMCSYLPYRFPTSPSLKFRGIQLNLALLQQKEVCLNKPELPELHLALLQPCPQPRNKREATCQFTPFRTPTQPRIKSLEYSRRYEFPSRRLARHWGSWSALRGRRACINFNASGVRGSGSRNSSDRSRGSSRLWECSLPLPPEGEGKMAVRER